MCKFCKYLTEFSFYFYSAHIFLCLYICLACAFIFSIKFKLICFLVLAYVIIALKFRMAFMRHSDNKKDKFMTLHTVQQCSIPCTMQYSVCMDSQTPPGIALVSSQYYYIKELLKVTLDPKNMCLLFKTMNKYIMCRK